MPEIPTPGPEESADDYHDRVFGGLVQQSWALLREQAFASHIDEVFLGALITNSVDAGFILLDLTSDGTHHYIRLEDQKDKSRLIFRMTHLTGDLALARVLGQQASVVIGYGEKVGDASKIMGALKAEMKGGYLRSAEPGTITVDGDLQSGYVYVQVDLTMTIDEYVSPDYVIDNARLKLHITATTHALRKYLRGRFA